MRTTVIHVIIGFILLAVVIYQPGVLLGVLSALWDAFTKVAL